MKTLHLGNPVYATEGASSGTANASQDTAKQTSNVLETPELKMKSRNLNYPEVGASLIKQLKEYVENAGVESMHMGVSGGVDSGLVSTLAAETGIPLYVYELPIHQAEDEVSRAENHIEWLQANYDNVYREKIDLTDTFETMKKAFPQIKNEEVIRYMAYVNSRSRLRGVTLYAMANEKNGIVLGTGNRVEDYGIGFFTKFGDGAVDVSPIGELYKSEVRALCDHLGVNQEIVEAVATDGLHTTGATDEDQIGCTYDELEWAMVEYDNFKDMVTSNFSSPKDPELVEDFINSFTGRAQEVMKIYLKRHLENAHKMEMPPVFPIKV